MKRPSIIIVFLTLLFAFTVASQAQMQMPKPGPEQYNRAAGLSDILAQAQPCFEEFAIVVCGRVEFRSPQNIRIQ